LVWVVDGYVLTAGGLLLLGGRLADLVGRRRMFFLGIGVFTLASVISGAAQDPAMLVTSRFLQGAGEAMAGPAAFGLIALLFPSGPERIKAVGIFGGVAGLGGTFGPIISGLLVQASWRLIFFVNVPVALFAAIAVGRLVSESRADRALTRGRPDVLGAVLVTAGLTGVVYGLIEAGVPHPWESLRVLAPLLAGVVLLGLFVLVEATIGDPLVPLGFFKNRTRVGTNVATIFFSAGFFSLFYLLTLYWEETLHYSAIKAGLLYLPFGVGIGIGIGVSTALVSRVGVKQVMIAGFVLCAAGLLLVSRIEVHGSYVSQALPGILLMAFGSGLLFAGFGNASVHQVSQDDASLASGVQNAVQQIGGAIGLAVLATIALRHATSAAQHGVVSASATVSGDVLAFRVGAGVLVVGGVLVAVLLERYRAEPPGLAGTSADPEPVAAGA
jgi:EmrB/QacA subfamily drug resistance transporter